MTSTKEDTSLWEKDSSKCRLFSMQPISKCFYKHFLVGVDDLDHHLIKEGEVRPLRFRKALMNIKKLEVSIFMCLFVAN